MRNNDIKLKEFAVFKKKTEDKYKVYSEQAVKDMTDTDRYQLYLRYNVIKMDLNLREAANIILDLKKEEEEDSIPVKLPAGFHI